MTANELIDQLHDYFNDIKIIAAWKLGRLKLQSPAYEKLMPLFNKIINNLISKNAREEFCNAIRQEDDSEIIGYLKVELQFFHKLVEEFESEIEGKEKEDKGNKALGAAKTIKDSLEKWLKDWLEKHPWFKKLLDILNELLSIIKSG